MTHPSRRGQTQDAYIRAWLTSSLFQDWQEFLNDHGMCEMIYGKVKLETILANTSGNEHDTCITPEVQLATVMLSIVVW